MISRISSFFTRHPMVKGMAIYSVIWPSSSLMQQVITKEDFDWKKSFRYFMYGTFFVAPTLYGWIRVSSHMWPKMNIRSGLSKALTEQISYGPIASCCFFTLMTLMEGRSLADAKNEVCEKFPRTYKGKV